MALGRQNALQVEHFIRRSISFANGASDVLRVGILPAGAVINHVFITVGATGFNAGTNNNVSVGTAAAPTSFFNAQSIATPGRKTADLSASTNLITTGDTEIIVTMALTGTAATAGSAVVQVDYVPNNDR